MKIEDLNKTQIVLLTLLVSFVTSIATGVVTVSLMEQAPQGITQTINRVVERTIETVTPSITGNSSPSVTKETTVVVKEEDLLTKSIDTASQSVVAVSSRIIDSQGLAENIFLGWGTIVSSDGVIVTDSGIIAEGGDYIITTNDGINFVTKVVSQNEALGIAVLAATREKDNKDSTNYIFKPATLADSNKVNLGQTAIAIGGSRDKKSVAVGVISSVIKAPVGNATSTAATRKVTLIEANIRPAGGVTGGPLVNTFGEVVAMSIKSGFGEGVTDYMPAQFLKDEAGIK